VALFCVLYKRTEKRFLELAAIVESSEDAIFSRTLDGVITSWNAGALRLFGYAAGEVLGRPASLLLPPDRPDEQSRIVEAIKRGERVAHFETVRMRKDASQVLVSLSASLIVDAGGRVVEIAMIARDITECKRAAEAGGVASELEDQAAQGELEEAQPLVARLETMAEELLRLVGGLSLDALRAQAGAANDAREAAER
jgi:PAS domain S-box-containing protein